jgi:hypothetical protein
MIPCTLKTLGVTPAKAGVHPEICGLLIHLRMDSGLRRNDTVVVVGSCMIGDIP